MAIVKRDEIIKRLKIAKPDLQERFGLKELALFGSVARRENIQDSDIDILVDLKKNTSSDFFGIAFFLQDLFHPSKVDVVTKRGIRPVYFSFIKDDLIYV